MISVDGLTVEFGGSTLFADISFVINEKDRIALMGKNGAGKSTLLKILAGAREPSRGKISAPKDTVIAYLPQHLMTEDGRTVFEETAQAFSHLHEMESEIEAINKELETRTDYDSEEYYALIERVSVLSEKFYSIEETNYDADIEKTLLGLGFKREDFNRQTSDFSGGWRMRIELAKLLLKKPDVILLDEPTNHLDIEATRFLEKFLAGYHGAAVIVSHDRYLLDRVVDKIADLDERKIIVYPCAYSDYAEAKRIRLLTAEREYEKQKEWIDHQREYAERVKADKSRAKQARGRLLYLDRMENEGRVLDRPVAARRRMAIQFTPSRRAGDMVMRCERVRKAYGDVVLFDDFNLEIYRGEKIGIVGPNGVGKTTLLKMALRLVPPDAGEVRLYENLQVGYYDQEHADLDERHNVLEAVDPSASGPQQGELRSFLAKFLFQGNDVFKPVGMLSGGEQSRVVLARLVYANPQVLILDEPTNHLDIPSKEVLEDALIAYEGAILLVSHDRYFLDRVVNKLLVLPERGRYDVMTGNWSTYEARLNDEEIRRKAEQVAARKQERRNIRYSGRRTGRPDAQDNDSPYASWSLGQLEDAIIEREEQLANLEMQFADPAVYRDADKARMLRGESERLRAELAEINAEWERRG